MSAFLEELAKYVCNRNIAELGECCMVFPSRRAGLFFLKYLSDLNKTPAWGPSIITISDVFTELSGIQPTDPLTLIVHLYKVFREQTGTNEPFDSFYFWGEMLLGDFDDLDKHLVDARKIFKTISDFKEIERDLSFLSPNQMEAIGTFWHNFDGSRLSTEKENFAKLWASLFPVYKQFRELLFNSGLAYEGMICREIAERIRSMKKIDLPWKKMFIAGFNVLNECEKELFRYLFNNNLAEFFWDYDLEYIEDTNHEAGKFIRENLREFPSPLSESNFRNLAVTSKNIHIIAESSHTGQAATAGAILDNLYREGGLDYENTAVVMADESLLIPFLYSIPESCRDVNITMGLPVTETPIYSFLESIIQLSQNARIENGIVKYYHRDVIGLLKSRYIRNNPDKIDALAGLIIADNRVYLTSEEICVTEDLKKIFPLPDKLDLFSALLSDILHWLYTSLPTGDSNSIDDITLLEKESIFRVFLSMRRLQDLLTQKKIELQLSTYRLLLRRLLSQQKINFSGEPLRGLQAMGLLETRCLDFQNLIILSANEDILPRKSQLHSFIPYNLRKGFGMSTPERQDAMYAYYFYRLIQRSEKIYLLYNSIPGTLHKGEMSRYLVQLKYSSHYNVSETAQIYAIGTLRPNEIIIGKEGRVWSRMAEFIRGHEKASYLSPSALSTYLDCPLKFCFRYLAGIRETREVTEEIDHLMFGTILHETIHRLYNPYQGKIMSKEIILNISKNNDMIQRSIKQSIYNMLLPGQSHQETELTGRNIIVSEMLKKYTVGILKMDISFAPVGIISLENKVKTEIVVKSEQDTFHVCLGGRIDRTDMVNGIKRIIDYKTGGEEKIIKSMADLFDPVNGKGLRPAFQILTYCYIQYLQEGDARIQPGIYYLKKIFANDFDSRLPMKLNKTKERIDTYEAVRVEFETGLAELLSRIFDRSEPFTQTRDDEICKNCEFVSVCHRD